LTSGENNSATMTVGPSAIFGILGTSTGYVSLASADTTATNYVATLPANTGTVAELNAVQTFSVGQTFSAQVANTASGTSAQVFTSSPYSGGTGTTNVPLLYLKPGATAPTTFSAGGTFIGINAASGFTGNFFDLRVNGAAPVASLSYTGALTVSSCTGCGSGSSAFSALTGSTNTTAAMVVGTGTSLTPTGTGAITATNYLPSVNTATSGTSVTPNCTYPVVQITISTGTAFTFNAPGTCTPVNGQRMEVDVLASASGTPAYTWTTGASGDYIGSTDVALPTAGGGASLEDDFTFTYSTLVNRWKLMAYSRGY
jgi:hypothetical protein